MQWMPVAVALNKDCGTDVEKTAILADMPFLVNDVPTPACKSLSSD